MLCINQFRILNSSIFLSYSRPKHLHFIVLLPVSPASVIVIITFCCCLAVKLIVLLPATKYPHREQLSFILILSLMTQLTSVHFSFSVPNLVSHIFSPDRVSLSY